MRNKRNGEKQAKVSTTKQKRIRKIGKCNTNERENQEEKDNSDKNLIYKTTHFSIKQSLLTF
jgi:competence protein ComGF